MAVIHVEGLGNVEIAGSEPTPVEAAAIKKALAEQQASPPRHVVTDSLLQVVGGVRDASQNLLNNAINNPSLRVAERYPELLFSEQPFKPVTLPEVPQADTTVGAFTRGISQFLVPYLGALKAVGLSGSMLQKFATIEGTAILTEQAVISPFEERLSNLVESYPFLSNPVTSFLEADPDDSEAMARFRMAMESVGLTVVAAPLSIALNGLKRIRTGQYQRALKDIEEAQRGLPDIVEAPPPQAFLGTDARVRDFAMNVNLKNIDAEDDVKNVLQVTAETFEGRIDDARRGVVTDEQLRQLARDSNLTVDELLNRQTGEAWSAERILAARQMMASSAQNLLDTARVATTSTDDADLLAFKAAMNLHLSIQEEVSGLAAEAGRALRQFREAAGVDVENLLGAAGGRGTLREQAELMAQIDDVGSITGLARAMDEPTWADKGLEVWINFLLSGPQTHAVNALSNTLTGLWSVPEHFLAAGIGAVRRTPDRETFGEVASRTFGWFQGARDGWSLASKTFLTEEPSDLFTKVEVGRQRAISGRLGQGVRLPGRALMASDEFFKSIGYRMELNAEAYRRALDAGLNPRSREFAEHMQGIIANPPADISLQAIENARYLTFTKPLEGVSRHITAAQRELPVLRVFMPFVRTPTNIVRFAGERTPFGLLMRETRDATGAELDRQMAKITMGSMAGASVTAMALDGHITGSGPSDPVSRNILRETGWQPYSFVFEQEDGTKQYVAYNRVEPLGILFGLAADFSQIAGEMTEEERDHMGAMISAAVSQNLTDKTFFKGLSDMIQAVSEPEARMEAYLRNLAGTVVPTGLAQIARVQDPILRDAQSVMQRIMSRIPGYSEDVPARLNLWGEPIVLSGGLGPDIISPLYTSHGRYDAPTNELIRLEYFPRLPQRTLDGEEIPQEEYWTYVRNAGRLAHQQINHLIQTPQWRNLDRFPSTQESILRRVINENRDIARAVLRMRLNRPLNRQQREILEEFGVELPQAANE